MKQRSTDVRNRAATGTQAVDRAIAVLQAIGEARVPAGLAELSVQLGLHKTTVFRLLGALERAEFVRRDAERQSYELGPMLIRLGARARRSIGLTDAARPELEALALETGETVTLEVLVGDEVLILDEVHGHFLIGSRPEVGMRWPAHATSTGKVLLAAAPPPPPIAARLLVRLGPHTITSRPAFERELATVRKQGFAIAREELEAGFVAVAAPIRNVHGDAVAAISVGGPTNRITKARARRFAPLLCRSAARVSAQLGHGNQSHLAASTAPVRRHRAPVP